MITVCCHTNIDCAKQLSWPAHPPERPLVGDLIRSASSTDSKYIELEVVRCTWFANQYGSWMLDVELHLVKSRWLNLEAFEKWVTGRS